MSIRLTQALATALLAAALAACADDPTAAPAGDDARAALSRQAGTKIPNQYVVVFHDDVADAPGLARRLAAAHGGKIRHTYEHALRGFSGTFSPAAAEALGRNPRVKYVAQDEVIRVAQWPLGAFWGQDRVSQRDRPLDDIIKFNRTGSGVTIYVLDTGIQTGHGDFGSRASVGYDALGGNGQDCNGHGTHVAGIAAGEAWGVAKAATLVAVRVLDCYGNGQWADFIEGVDWVSSNHATRAVANMSLSGGGYAAADTAVINMISAGVVAVVAAGNNSGDACSYSPARVSGALTVAASDSADVQASFSNYGTCVDLYAPGKDIRSAWISNIDSLESGTSMAAPYVAGAAALYLQALSSATPSAVNTAVLGNASSGKLSSLGSGSPNLLLHAIFGRWPIHRHYNSSTGDRMYGWFPYEQAWVGYWPETQNYFYLESQPASGYTALYRCLSGTNSLLTTASNCEGATHEGIRGYIATSQLTGTVPLYRLYKSSIPDDIYTISSSEVTSLQGAGYTLVGTTGYVYTSAW
ncbi:MAG TPA: S8 family peptidase [Longimicrobium sp.]|nr:S8 family peptidase [Longimicrobium sp.]